MPTFDKICITEILSTKKQINQFLPEKLRHLTTNKYVEFNSVKLKTDYIIDIVHNLVLKYYFKKDNYFHLYSLVLKSKYGQWYNYYMNYLLDKGYIHLVRNYIKGESARVYKLDDEILVNKVNRYLNKDSCLLKKYKKNLTSTNQDGPIIASVKKKLIEDLFSLGIMYEESLHFLDNYTKDDYIYNKNKFTIDGIKDQDIFVHFDIYGRMHTNFTILKSQIRKNFLLIDGEETVEVDIPNSQPLFLCKLIETEDHHLTQKQEFQTFKDLTVSGKFYDYVMDRTSISEKKQVKQMIYKVFFGKNYSNSLDDQKFGNLFPLIYEFIKGYKIKKDDYRVLAHDLQKLESDLIFNKIIKEIMYLYPEIKLCTIHDSIMCQSRYQNQVEKIFFKNLNKVFQNYENIRSLPQNV